MWKVSGRSSALNRAEALLSAKRSSAGDGGGSTQDSPTKTQVGTHSPERLENVFSSKSWRVEKNIDFHIRKIWIVNYAVTLIIICKHILCIIHEYFFASV